MKDFKSCHLHGGKTWVLSLLCEETAPNMLSKGCTRLVQKVTTQLDAAIAAER